MLDGVTFSGGDPFFNPEESLPIIKKVKETTGLDVWCYTGYTIEQIEADRRRSPILRYIDTLVDGKFDESLYSPYLDFRGSSNQRIIKVKHENKVLI